jgi:hypothetical protein
MATHHKSSAHSRLRDLIKRDYAPEQVAVLRSIESNEGAARFTEHAVDVQTVVAPADNLMEILSEQTGLPIIRLSDYPRRPQIAFDDHRRPGHFPARRPGRTQAGCTIVVAIADPSNRPSPTTCA